MQDINLNIHIGVIGLGVVGGAMYDYFKKTVKTSGYDKFNLKGNVSEIKDLLSCNILFLVLPTPYSQKLCEYDKSAIYETCKALHENNYKGVVVLKSTVEPETTTTLASQYGLKLMHNPEFISAATAYEDFAKQEHIVLGRTTFITDDDYNLVKTLYNELFPQAQISECKSLESELMKLSVNNFYAVKIQFFNEIYLLSEKINVDYNMVKNLMLKNGWINHMHTQVPGLDGKLSYGGMCFPKDTYSFRSYMETKESPCDIIKACINERYSMRND